MTAGELRRELRQRKKELRRSVKQMKREALARVEQHPSVRREKRRRRIRRAVTLAVLVLLALLIRCECAPSPPAPPPEPVAVSVTPVVKPKKPVPPPVSKPTAFDAGMARQRRGNYQNESQTSPGWLDDFRLQVAARSPRLARCFQGAERPGVLRWTTGVNAASGSVSDHELEQVGTHEAPTAKQRDCVLGVLANPGYRLTPEQAQDLPRRVSLLIEF